MDQLRLRRANTSHNLELRSQLQVTNIFWNGSTRLGQSIYRYGAASRLQTVGDGTRAVGYTYLANSLLVCQIGFTNSGTLRMTTSKQYDYLNRLLSISSAPAAASTLSFNYTQNDANQRVKVTLADASFWLYEYDSLGQVQSGKRYWPDWTPVAGQQFEYAHDDIGNRNATKAGGDDSGAGLRPASYLANSLNQCTNRTVPGAVDITGVANVMATVTVNNQSTYRHGEYYRKELAVTNTAAAQWQSVTNKAVQSGTTNTVTGNIFLAKTPEAFTYDADGNLLTDGRWNYVWDAENRLLEMGVNTAVGAQKYLRFEYDWQGRRTGKKLWNSASGNGQAAVAQKFLYDGWNLIGILNSSFALQTSFTWGLDLSGSLQGAGGVGGLVAINDVTNGVHFAAYDGSGNVGALVRASDGTVSAGYEYGPFGELLRATGPMAKVNSFRFSTKYQDDEMDLLCYGYRYYNASTGRWLSRDPIEERGGLNIYEFAGNAAPNAVDQHGLFDIKYVDDGRRWSPDFEVLWVMFSFGFDSTDARKINGDGFMLTEYSASIEVKHCSGVSSGGSVGYFKLNRISLAADGSLRDNDQNPTDYYAPFVSSRPRIPFQMAGWSVQQVFYGFPELSLTPEARKSIRDYDKANGWHSKGRFEASLTWHVLPRTGSERLGGFYDPGLPYPSFLGTEYAAHNFKEGSYLTSTVLPDIWGNLSQLSGTINLQFEWNNCCGRRYYKHHISPTGIPKGPNRSGRSGAEDYAGSYVVPPEE